MPCLAVGFSEVTFKPTTVVVFFFFGGFDTFVLIAMPVFMLDKGKDKSKIEKYIHLVYSRESELIAILDFNDRKIKACNMVGLDPEQATSRAIMDLSNETVRDQIFEYLKTTSPLNYIQYISDVQLFWEIQARKMRPLADTTDDELALKNLNLKTTMSAKSEELLDRINKLAKEIFQGSEEMKMAEDKIRKLPTAENRLKQKQA